MTKKMPDKIANNFVYRRVWNLLHHLKMNVVFLIVGDVGKGKSTAAMKLAEDIDPLFSVERICFTVTEFLHLINHGDKHGKLRKGAVIIFDEAAGSRDAIDARDSLSHTNKTLSQFTTISRAKQLVIIYCSPLLSQIDKRVRLIGVTGIFNMLGVDFNEKRSKAGFNWCYASSLTDKVIRPKPRLKDDKDNRLNQVFYITFPMPNKELNKAYLKKKMAFINKSILGWSKEADEKVRSKARSAQTIKSVMDRAIKIKDKLIGADGKASLPLICYHLEVGRCRGRIVKNFLEAKYRGLALSN